MLSVVLVFCVPRFGGRPVRFGVVSMGSLLDLC